MNQLPFAILIHFCCALSICSAQNKSSPAREEIEQLKKVFHPARIVFLRVMVEHQVISTVPVRAGEPAKHVLHWGSVKVEKVLRGGHQLNPGKYVSAIWLVPKFEPSHIVSYPVQVGVQALERKPMLWICQWFDLPAENSDPLMVSKFSVIEPSTLHLTVFDELTREDKEEKK